MPHHVPGQLRGRVSNHHRTFRVVRTQIAGYPLTLWISLVTVILLPGWARCWAGSRSCPDSIRPERDPVPSAGRRDQAEAHPQPTDPRVRGRRITALVKPGGRVIRPLPRTWGDAVGRSGLRLPDTSSVQVNSTCGLDVEAVDPASNLVLWPREVSGMMAGWAAAFDLSRRDQRLRRAAAAVDERPGQGRGDFGSASSACCAAAVAWSGPGHVAHRERTLRLAMYDGEAMEVTGNTFTNATLSV
jgi:hypothetical protein